MTIIERLASEFNIRKGQVEATLGLIDEGNTIPFIARYRKEATGGLDDEVLRELFQRLTYLRNLEERKEEVIRLIDEQEKLTDELKTEILNAETLQKVEDLYKPFKQKKQTRATKAKEKGLEPLALDIYNASLNTSVIDAAKAFINEEKEVLTEEDALAGARDIIAEILSDDAKISESMRELFWDKAKLVTEGVNKEEKTAYDMYYEYDEAIKTIPNHRVLAINRGEKEKALKVKLVIEPQYAEDTILSIINKDENKEGYEEILTALRDSYKRLIFPTVEREIRNKLTDRAEEEAVKVFAKNTEKLLMSPGVKNARIIAMDPGYRTGVKVAVINETGKLLAYTTVYPTKPKEDIAGTEKVLDKLIEKFNINTIVIGNGTASRETEEVVANYLKKANKDVKYTIVNEAGASVYSASKLASEEYPDLDVATRGAMSLGRRLQDPLAELVKIPTKSIGVGQYQHDINQKNLEEALDDVVERAVNTVGVNLNTASPSLLVHISGVNSSIAKNIVAYREENGSFSDRSQLKKVPKLGPKAFEQCAGFLRIEEGNNPLDATSVHPESYSAAKDILATLDIDIKKLKELGGEELTDKIIEKFGVKNQERLGKTTKSLADLKKLAPKKENKAKALEDAIDNMAKQMDIGTFTLRDIIGEIRKKGKDHIEEAPDVVFRKDVTAIEDLEIGMILDGTIRNVVDFGVFVDIGIKNDGLVHISEMSNKFIKHPMDIVSVGDNVKVQIINIDHGRGKVGLTMKVKEKK